MEFRNRDLVKVNTSRLARVLGVNPSTVWRWQTGLSRPTRRHQAKVEQVLQELSPLVLPELREEDQTAVP